VGGVVFEVEMPVTVIPATTPALRAKALALRDEVFVGEQGVPAELEHDALDETAFHVVALDGGRCVGTGRFLRQADGVARVGRMAVARSERGRGVGGLLLGALEAQARAEGLAAVELHAQVHAQRFYARHGYAPEGAVFEEAGIPHQMMRKAW
jgi:predicted GNAT family N-acyltransferase